MFQFKYKLLSVRPSVCQTLTSEINRIDLNVLQFIEGVSYSNYVDATPQIEKNNNKWK